MAVEHVEPVYLSVLCVIIEKTSGLNGSGKICKAPVPVGAENREEGNSSMSRKALP